MTPFNIRRSRGRSLGQYALRLSLLVSILSISLRVAWAVPVLPHVISDHMVLQRNREIHIWGLADPGENITVTLARNTRSVKTDSEGHWSVHLPTMSAGGPFTPTIQGKKTILLGVRGIGEVWRCHRPPT